MANVNVNRNVTDAFYRYKMPRLIAKVEGKGNGIKTVIVNMSEIAKALSRPPTYPTKYFGCELGAQTQFDPKNDRFIVNGAHDSAKLQDLLDGFIRKFVLCQGCDNPETNLIVQAKKGMIVQRCIACGHQGNIDMRHKLTTFIINHPPEPDPTSTGGSTPSESTDKTPNTKKGKKERGKKETDNGNGDVPSENHKSSSRKEKAKKDESDDDDWGEDTSEEAVKRRMEALSHAAKSLTISEDVEKTAQQRVDIFYSFVKQRKVAGDLVGVDKEKEIICEAERLEIKDEAPLVLAELLYDTNILTQIKHYRNLFLRLTQENQKAQRSLLGAYELLVGSVHHDALMPKAMHILKMLFDEDLVEEEVILEWDEKASKKYVSKEVSKEIHTAVAPFIKWLKEAEEETSEGEEDSEDDDVKVVYSDSVPAAMPKASAVKSGAGGDEGEESDGDDIDVDAI